MRHEGRSVSICLTLRGVHVKVIVKNLYISLNSGLSLAIVEPANARKIFDKSTDLVHGHRPDLDRGRDYARRWSTKSRQSFAAVIIRMISRENVERGLLLQAAWRSLYVKK